MDISHATPNANQRLTNMLASPPVGPQDTCSNCGSISWNSSTRVLTINSGGVLTLTGDTYLLCRLETNGGAKLQIPSRTKPLYIYIDTPEHCGGTSGMGSVVLDGQLENLYSPPEALAILVAGSSTIATSVDLPHNDSTNPIGIYAPNSTVTLKNNVEFTGAVVAKTLDVKNNAVFSWDATVGDIRSDSGIRHYQAVTGTYKECTSAAATLDSHRRVLTPWPAAARRARGPDADPAPSIAHAHQEQAVRLGRGTRLRRLAPRPAARAKSSRSRRPPATSSIVPTSTRTMCRMKASASIQNSSTSPSRVHPPRGRRARTARARSAWA